MMQKQTNNTTVTTQNAVNANNQPKSDLTPVGAIWENQASSGSVYFTLKIDEGKSISHTDKVVIFTNNKKSSAKAPDLYVFVKSHS